MNRKIIILIFILAFFHTSFIIINLEWQSPGNFKNNSINKQFETNEEKISPKGSSSTPEWIASVDAQPTVAISANGSYIACGCTQGDDWGRNYLFSKSSSIPLWTHNNNSKSIAISADGQYILMAGVSDRNVYLYNNTSSLPIWHTVTDTDISSVAISADGNYFAVGRGHIQIYNITSEKSNPILIMSEGSGFVWDIAISSNGNYIAVGRGDGVYLYNTSRPNPKLVWYYSTSMVRSVAISSSGDYIAAFSNNVFLFNITKSTPLWWGDVNQVLGTVDISSDGQYIVAGVGSEVAGGDEIILYKNSSSTPLWRYSVNSPVCSVSISANGEYVAAGTDALDRRIYIFHKSSSTPLWSYQTDKNKNNVAISSDGNYLVVGGNSGSLFFFNVKANIETDLLTFSKVASRPTKLNVDMYYSFIQKGTLYAKIELTAGEIYLIVIDDESNDVTLYNDSSYLDEFRYASGLLISFAPAITKDYFLSWGSDKGEGFIGVFKANQFTENQVIKGISTNYINRKWGYCLAYFNTPSNISNYWNKNELNFSYPGILKYWIKISNKSNEAHTEIAISSSHSVENLKDQIVNNPGAGFLLCFNKIGMLQLILPLNFDPPLELKLIIFLVSLGIVLGFIVIIETYERYIF